MPPLQLALKRRTPKECRPLYNLHFFISQRMHKLPTRLWKTTALINQNFSNSKIICKILEQESCSFWITTTSFIEESDHKRPKIDSVLLSYIQCQSQVISVGEGGSRIKNKACDEWEPRNNCISNDPLLTCLPEMQILCRSVLLSDIKTFNHWG